MDRYIFDKYVASKFLGIKTNDPMVEKFTEAVQKILNERVAEFLVDYSTLKMYDFEIVFEAYKQFKAFYMDSNSSAKNSKDLPKDPKVYEILLDQFFYNGIDEKVNNYYKLMYDKYVGGMSEKAKEDLQAYIDQKNKEEEEKTNKSLELIDDILNDMEELKYEAQAIVVEQGGEIYKNYDQDKVLNQ